MTRWASGSCSGRALAPRPRSGTSTTRPAGRCSKNVSGRRRESSPPRPTPSMSGVLSPVMPLLSGTATTMASRAPGPADSNSESTFSRMPTGTSRRLLKLRECPPRRPGPSSTGSSICPMAMSRCCQRPGANRCQTSSGSISIRGSGWRRPRASPQPATVTTHRSSADSSNAIQSASQLVTTTSTGSSATRPSARPTLADCANSWVRHQPSPSRVSIRFLRYPRHWTLRPRRRRGLRIMFTIPRSTTKAPHAAVYWVS